jgi:ankyrin repeat protein
MEEPTSMSPADPHYPQIQRAPSRQRPRLVITPKFLAAIEAVNLHEYATSGDIAEVRKILETWSASSHESRRAEKEEALYAAVNNNRLGVVEYLVSSGVAVECRNDGERTLLHIAAAQGHLGIVQHLVQHAKDKKAYVNSEDTNKKTALHQVASVEIANYLIEAGADIICLDRNQETPASYASEEDKRSSVLELLIRLCPAQINERRGRYLQTLLHHAGSRGTMENVELLLSRGADATLQDRNGKTAWDLAYSSRRLASQCSFAYSELMKGPLFAEIGASSVEGAITQSLYYLPSPTVRLSAFQWHMRNVLTKTVLMGTRKLDFCSP